MTMRCLTAPTVGGYATWYTETKASSGIPVGLRFVLASLVGLLVGTVFAALVEFVLIRPLYKRHIEQVLVTVGLARTRYGWAAAVALGTLSPPRLLVYMLTGLLAAVREPSLDGERTRVEDGVPDAASAYVGSAR